MEPLKTVIGGIGGVLSGAVGGLWPVTSVRSEPTYPANSGHVPENMDASQEEQSEWCLVSQQSASDDSDIRHREQFPENTAAPPQEQTEWRRMSQQSPGGKYQYNNCLVLRLKQGSVADEEADVLVSSVGCDLNLSQGMISKSMLLKTGPAMQQELYNRYPDGIHEFDFAISSAHGLSCKHVLHVACGHFKAEESKKKFVSALYQCLRFASDNGRKSIAFPPIGTGNLKYAPQMVAQFFLEAATEFLKIRPNQSLEIVTLAVFDSQAYQIFKSALDSLIPGDSFVVEENKNARVYAMASQSSMNSSIISEESNTSMEIDETTKSPAESAEGGLQIKDDNVLEFVAPDGISEELVTLHFSEITKKPVECKTESSIVQVSFDKEEAFQQILEQKIGTEYELIDTGSFLPTTASQRGITADSCSFVLLSLQVASRVHITEHCLEELSKFLNDRRYSLHRTAVPGELVLEWRGPSSERNDQLVVSQICKYASNFETIVIEISEPHAVKELCAMLRWPSADRSCIKMGQRRKDQLYIITGKKHIVMSWHSWLRNVTTVHHSLLVPFTAIDGLECRAISGSLRAGGSAAATPEMLESVPAKERITPLGAKVVELDFVSVPGMTNIAFNHAFSHQLTDKSKLAGNCASSSPRTCGLNSSVQYDATHQSSDNSSEPSSCDVAANGGSLVACSTLTSDDTLTQEAAQREGNTGSSTNQPQLAANSDSLLPLLEGDVQQNVPKESLPSRETAHHDHRSPFCDKENLQQQKPEILRMHGQSRQQNFSGEVCTFLRAQTEDEWLAEQERNGIPRGRVHLWSNSRTSTSRVQENEQSSHQCSDFLKGVNETRHAQTEEQWLAEQERNRTPRGYVHLWSNSGISVPTTRRQLEHEQDDSGTEFCAKNQNSMPTKPGAVILNHTSTAAAGDESEGHRRPQAINNTHEHIM